MFHSSGTARGKVEKMNRWKQTISTTPASVSHLLVENSSTNGVTISTMVPKTCPTPEARRDGRMSCGKSR